MKSISLNIKSSAHTPQYKMHKYFARRPYNVFNEIIKFYTKKGDIIVDPFCGGGVTVFEGISLDRKVIGVDINPLATFITKMELYKNDSKNVDKILTNFIQKEYEKYGDLYRFNYNNTNLEAIWSEYIYNVKCPKCENNVILDDNNKIKNGIYHCNKCDSDFKRIDGISNGSSLYRVKTQDGVIINNNDIKFKTIPKYKNSILDVYIPKNWDRALEDCLYQKGIQKFSDFYTERNAYINYMIYNDIKNENKEIMELLYLLFSSSLRYSNNMTRVTENWENGNPTSMDKHAFWFPNQYVENNIFDVLNKRKKSIVDGVKYIDENISKVKFANNFNDIIHDSNCWIINNSSTHLEIPNQSIDMIITDPPYGSNVQYGELSSLWNIWYSDFAKMNSFINNKEEAIMNRKSGEKGADFYRDVLKDVFTEMNRVLKDDGLMVFTFNNKDINVWLAMLDAVVKAGFELNENGICFQNFIDSYKNTSHLKYDKNVQGDFIYTFKKSTSSYDNADLIDLDSSIELAIKDISLKNSKITTNELYRDIFLNVTNNIMGLIKNGEPLPSNLAKQFIDKKIEKYFVLKDGIWEVK